MGKTKFLCCCTWCWCFWVKLHGHRHRQTESNEPRIGGENARKWNKSKCKCNANKQSEGCSERAVTFARHCGTFHWKYLRHRSLCSFIHSSCFTFFVLPFCSLFFPIRNLAKILGHYLDRNHTRRRGTTVRMLNFSLFTGKQHSADAS